MTQNVNRAGTVLRFAEFELDPFRRRLTRESDVISLQRQPMTVLLELVQRPGELVTRQELYDKVWGDTVVEFDQALNYAIRQVRAALGDSADRRLIETVRGKGYRLLVPVEEREARPRFATARLVGGGVAVVALLLLGGWWTQGTPARSLALLDASAEAEAPTAVGYLTRGHEFFRRNAMERDVAEASEMYEAATNLDPSSAEAFAWLAIAKFTLAWDWDRSAERDAAEAALRRAVELAPGETATELALGYSDYTAGRYGAALDRFARVREQVPDEPAVLVPLAYAHRRLWNHGEALKHFMLAFELQPRSYEIAIGIASTAHALQDLETAERYYDWCIALAPDDPMAYVLKGWTRINGGGRTAGLLEVLNEGAARGDVTSNVAQVPGLSRILAQSPLEWTQPSPSLNQVDRAEYLIGWAEWSAGRGEIEESARLFTEAAGVLEALADTASSQRASRQGRLELLQATAYAGLGQSERSVQVVERALDLVGDDGFTRPWALMWAARAAGIAGDTERAELWLAEMLQNNGPFNLRFVESDPLWATRPARVMLSRLASTR